jgi:glycosyltransferase involved in cell wall biosynthesis
MLEVIIFIADIVLVGVWVVMGRQLARGFTRHTAPQYTTKIDGEVDLPSVSVCIPARNEQHALTDCLTRVLASTYEKLEIIVLDDVSGDDTSALIKSFAHEGVRFVKGDALSEGWLGKNHALQGLLKEASGTYVLFVDVDTVLAPTAVENMVRYALSKRASMVSVLPRREDGWRGSVIASPLRYFWELLFNRRETPAVASSAWLIRRDVLQTQFDGFKSLKDAVQPEAKIAAELANTNHYAFLVGTETFGVSYEKKWRSQLLTSVRMLYPVLGKKVLLTIMAALDLLILLIPTAVLIGAVSGRLSIEVIIVNVLLFIAFAVLYSSYTRRMWRRGWLIGAVIWPLIVLQEAILVIASMVQYKRHSVRWKGRLIRPAVKN